MKTNSSQNPNPSSQPAHWSRALRNFLIEVGIYATLVTAYFYLALHLLASPLKDLFQNHLPVYAVVSLILIVIQGVLLEHLTSFLLERLGLQRFE